MSKKNKLAADMDEYQSFIHKSRYARWIDDKGRRESWQETVQRYVDFWVKRNQIDPKTANKMFHSIYNMEVMPSMRCLMTAGKRWTKTT